jgi:hypothetical protein
MGQPLFKYGGTFEDARHLRRCPRNGREKSEGTFGHPNIRAGGNYGGGETSALQHGKSPAVKKCHGLKQQGRKRVAAARRDRLIVHDAAEAAQPITGRGIGYKAIHSGPDPVEGAIGDAAHLPPAKGGPPVTMRAAGPGAKSAIA